MSISVYRKIGGALVHPVGFGAMGFAHDFEPYGAVPKGDEEALKILDAAYENGCRHWDSANVYGDSEELIGKWFKRTGKRSEIFLATKFGYTPNGGRGDPTYVRECIEESLKRLGTDYVDVYYLHRVDRNVPIETTVGAMAELVREGKVKYLGLSECGVRDLRRAHAVHPISALQMDYSPLWLGIEYSGVLAATKELGTTLVAFSPLAKGLITGQVKSVDDLGEDDFRRKGVPRFSKENFPKILSAVERIKQVADAHNCTTGQVAMAWLLAQSDNVVVIPGTKKLKYLLENIGAVDVKLTEEEIASVRKVAEECHRIPGDRYGAAGLAAVEAETPPLPTQ